MKRGYGLYIFSAVAILFLVSVALASGLRLLQSPYTFTLAVIFDILLYTALAYTTKKLFKETQKKNLLLNTSIGLLTTVLIMIAYNNFHLWIFVYTLIITTLTTYSIGTTNEKHRSKKSAKTVQKHTRRKRK